MAGLDAEALLAMTETSYIELVQWTGEQARSDKCGKLKSLTEGKRAAPPNLWQVADHPNGAVAVCAQAREKPRQSAVVRGCGKSRAPKASTTAPSARPKP